MSQQYATIIMPPHGWIVGGPEGATQLLLLQPAVVKYSDGTSDTLPALVPAVLPDGSTLTFDRGSSVWTPYTVKSSGVLSVCKESDLPTLTSSYAVLGRVTLHEVEPYPVDAYLATSSSSVGAIGGYAQARTITVSAQDAVIGSTSPASPTGSDHVVQLLVTGSDAASMYSGLQDQTGASDLAVFDTAMTTQIDVDVVQASSTTIEVWFKLRRAIAASGSDSQYALAWGNAAPTVKRILTSIYPFADDFTGAALDTTKWTLIGATAAVSGSTVTVTNPGNTTTGYLQTTITFPASYQARVRAVLPAPGSVNGLAWRDQGGSPALTINTYQGALYDQQIDVAGSGASSAFGAVPDNVYHTFVLARDTAGSGYLTEDALARVVLTAHPATTALPFQLQAYQVGAEVQADWVKLFPFTPNEPTCALGAALPSLSTEGSLLYINNGAVTRLPIGSTGQTLKVVNGSPTWV